MHPLAAASSTAPGGLWQYAVIFVLVAVGWAGVPAIGGAVIAGAAVLASQGSLDIAGVLVAAVLGTEAGGLVGYFVGLRWGRALMSHPGPWLGRRERALTAGEVLYARWGRLAVFFTPCLVSGIVKMKLSQFAVWNFIVGAVYVLSIGPSAYGVSQVASGQYSVSDVGPLIAGVAVAVAAVLLGVRYHRRRRKARSVGGIFADGAQTQAPATAEEDR